MHSEFKKQGKERTTLVKYFSAVLPADSDLTQNHGLAQPPHCIPGNLPNGLVGLIIFYSQSLDISDVSHSSALTGEFLRGMETGCSAPVGTRCQNKLWF